MLKDMIKARPTSRELNLCQDQHSCRADPRADLWSLHSGQPDTRVDTRPRSSLSVGLVYVSRNVYSGITPHCYDVWKLPDYVGQGMAEPQISAVFEIF